MTPSTITYSFGDLVLVPFPFTDQAASKRRPAVVVSSNAYNKARPDLVLMAVTSRISDYERFGEILISDWKPAGLLKQSCVKPILTTIQRSLVIRSLGKLGQPDLAKLRESLKLLLG